MIQAKGIVLKEQARGEADRSLTLLLNEYGKMTVTARGAGKPRSKFLAGTSLFTYADFFLFEVNRKGSGYYSVSSVEIIENFYELRLDYDRLRFGSVMLELCDRAILDGLSCDEILTLLLNCLWCLTRSQHPQIPALIFEFRFFGLLGLMPEVTHCSECGTELLSNEGRVTFFGYEGMLCQMCSMNVKPNTILSYASLETLNEITARHLKDAFKHKFTERGVTELADAARMFIRYHFDFELKSVKE